MMRHTSRGEFQDEKSSEEWLKTWRELASVKR